MAARRHKRPPPKKDWLLPQRYIDSSPSFLGSVWRLKHNRCEGRVARNDVWSAGDRSPDRVLFRSNHRARVARGKLLNLRGAADDAEQLEGIVEWQADYCQAILAEPGNELPMSRADCEALARTDAAPTEMEIMRRQELQSA